MSKYPAAQWRPVRNYGGAMTEHLGLVLHVQEGDNSPCARFDNAAIEASSTWWVAKSGAIEQYVDADDTAWAQESGNHQYNSVETEGFVADALTDNQLNALAALYRWGMQTYGWPLRLANVPGESGLGFHAMGGVAWGGHPCPGPMRISQRQTILDRAQTALTKEQVMGIAVAPRGSATREQGGGYVWGDRGHVYAFDGAPFCGLWDDPTRSDSSRHCVSLVPTATGQGYWLVSDRGEIYAYGDAPSANVHNYDVKDWGDFPIVGAFRNARVAKVGGLTLVRDDGKNLNKYELPA